MLATLAGQWSLLLVRGIAAIMFGFLTLLWPALSLAVLVILFGVYALTDGVTALVMAFVARPERGFGGVLFAGILGIGAGLMTFFYPGITAIALLAVIAAWAILTGVAAIVTAARLRRELSGEWVLYFTGALSLFLGGLLIVQPAVGALALAGFIAAYAMLSGTALVMLAVRMRQLARKVRA